VAHGADSFSWWTSRTPLNGQETLHGTLLDAAGRPRHMFGEVAQIGAELKRAWPMLRGTVPIADVAMLHDYPSRWSLKRDPLNKQYDAWAGYVAWHRAFAPLAGGIDVLRGTPDLGRYKMVIAPNLHLVDQPTVDRLTAYVRGGGHLVLGPRAGLRQRSNALWRTGAFDALLGARTDHYQTPETPVTLSGPAGKGQTSLWAERIADAAPGADVLMRYGAADGWLDGAPGVISRAVGKGRVTYIGAWLDPEGLAAVARWTAARAALTPLWRDLPDGVEVAARRGAGGTVHVAINWADAPRTITPPAGLTDRLTGKPATGPITLAPRDVAVLATR
jgi:beta-galactosidase